MSVTYLYLDTETTDLDPDEGHQVTEVAYILERDGEALTEKLLFVAHDKTKVGEWRRNKTDYEQRTHDNLREHHGRAETARILYNDCKLHGEGKEVHLIGTNPCFDVGHMKPLFREAEIPVPWSYGIIDIKCIALGQFSQLQCPPPQYRINQYLGFQRDNRNVHTSLEDVRECRRLFHGLMDRRGK